MSLDVLAAGDPLASSARQGPTVEVIGTQTVVRQQPRIGETQFIARQSLEADEDVQQRPAPADTAINSSTETLFVVQPGTVVELPQEAGFDVIDLSHLTPDQVRLRPDWIEILDDGAPRFHIYHHGVAWAEFQSGQRVALPTETAATDTEMTAGRA